MARRTVKGGTRPQAQEADEAVRDATLRGFLGYNLRRAYLVIRADLVEALAELDLRIVSFSALSLIVENPGLILSRLAEALSMERSNLVVVIDDLEQRDLIARSKLARDRRSFALRATVKGRRLHDRAVRAVRAHEARMTADLSAEERAALTGAVNRIEARGEAEDGRRPGSCQSRRDDSIMTIETPPGRATRGADES